MRTSHSPCIMAPSDLIGVCVGALFILNSLEDPNRSRSTPAHLRVGPQVDLRWTPSFRECFKDENGHAMLRQAPIHFRAIVQTISGKSIRRSSGKRVRNLASIGRMPDFESVSLVPVAVVIEV
jgi:hypothetical protein